MAEMLRLFELVSWISVLGPARIWTRKKIKVHGQMLPWNACYIFSRNNYLEPKSCLFQWVPVYRSWFIRSSDGSLQMTCKLMSLQRGRIRLWPRFHRHSILTFLSTNHNKMLLNLRHSSTVLVLENEQHQIRLVH